MWNHNYYVYITTNYDRTVLYVGVTNDLLRRLYEHGENRGLRKTFTGKYFCHYLIHYEHFSNIEHAIEREKEIKKWRREKKETLINTTNPERRFLNNELTD
ncbi:putative endonuclease [Mucilaginibacter sp. UYNi724]